MALKNYFKHLAIDLLAYFLLAVLLVCYLKSKGDLHFIDNIHFLQFDAVLYQDIKEHGYYESWLCAFFPAFPFLWDFLDLSPINISLVNAGIFILSSSTLAFYYNFNVLRQLFFATFPSLIFMFVPYTEALFFFTGTLLLIGLKTNTKGLIFVALLLGSLVRPTTFIFIPAIICCYFFTTYTVKDWLTKSILPVLTLIAGLFATIFIHFHFTGKWFIFFEAQKLWKNYLHFPQLPFRSWGGDASLRFDGSVLVIASVCGLYLIYLFREKLKENIIGSNDLIFSVLYILGTTFTILAYRDGNLYSLNRFIYATPFIAVALNSFLNSYRFKWKHVWILLLVTELLWLLFNSYNHIHNFLLFSMVSFYFSLILLSKHTHKIISNLSLFLLIAINCVGIIKLFYRFLNGGWIG